ncbi:DUF1289 domain-containing protein [Alteromonas halophila]|uniref:DUF1289 domain-containing protein n=1 Tax=Alteromonas halophila TaxID=516698 RepID=A0A918JPS6_9ALTE|nr:DUF1289 domain-containing protein [Alteromonas halophila]GGW93930.1 hypothetical protein GCM10007391_30290 [Alteromonas halophila]
MSADDPQTSTQLEFFEVPSPCIGVCEAGPRGFCKGCYRSREERLYWLKVDDATRRQIVGACHRRKMQAQRRQRQADEPTVAYKPQQQDLFHGTDNEG